MQQIILHIFIFIYGLVAVFTFVFFYFTVTIACNKKSPSIVRAISIMLWGIFIGTFWPLCGVFAIKEEKEHNRLKEMDEKRKAKK